MADTTIKHRHVWNVVVQHMHGTFIRAELEECACGASRTATYGLKRNYDLLTERCPDCGE